MPVAAAIAGAGILGAGASIISGNKAAKASKNAANANNALQGQIYSENEKTLSPYVQRGNDAGSAINNLLGLGDGVDWAAYVRGNPDALADYEKYHAGEDIATYGQQHYVADGSRRDLTPYTNSATNNVGLNNYLDSTGYKFQLQQGENSVQAALGAKGLLDSGAAQKSLNNYAQNQALTGFNSYLSALEGQQSTGLTAASAQAGVGQNYANAVSANNNNAANASGNASLAAGSAVNSALGNALSAYSFNSALGSSYGSAGAGNYGLGNIY